MCKQFSANDILNAKEVHLYDNGILYLIDKDDEAYGFSKGRTEWFHKENFWDYLDGTVDDEKLKFLLNMSYELTK